MPNSAYDINLIYSDMEQRIVASYKKNMARHSAEEVKEGFKWDMWQSKKLQDVQRFMKESKVITQQATKDASHLSKARVTASNAAGAESVDNLVKGVKSLVSDDSFGKANNMKLDALLTAVEQDLDNAQHAILRHVEDQYRQVMFKTQFMYDAGVTTLPQAIDMAAKDFLAAGINCIAYRNGAKVNIASYAEMVLRTSEKKAYLTGEGMRAAEYGIELTQVTSYGACSEVCLPWQGKVYVNDVYAGGKADGEHELLSFAMENGLFHPNCRHTLQPYFEGISELPKLDKTEAQIKESYKKEQRQRDIERNVRKYKRLAEGSISPEEQSKYKKKVREWQAVQRQHLKENPQLGRKYTREKSYGLPNAPDKIAVAKATSPYIEVDMDLVQQHTQGIKWTDLMQQESKALQSESRMYARQNMELLKSGDKLGHSGSFDAEAKYTNQIVKETKGSNYLDIYTKRQKHQAEVFRATINTTERYLNTDKKLGVLTSEQENIGIQQINALRSRLNAIIKELNG